MGKNNVLFNPLVVGSATVKASSTVYVSSTAAVTMGGTFSALSMATMPFAPKVLALDITEASISAAATSTSASFAAIPAYSWIYGAQVQTRTPFTKTGSVSSVTLNVGTAGDPNGLILSVAIGTGCNSGLLATSAIGGVFCATGPKMFSAATTFKALVLAAGGNLSTLSSGDLSAYVMYTETGIGSAVP